MFVIQPFYGMLVDRLGYKKCLLLSSGLASVSYALYLVDTSFTWIVFITVFMSVFYNAIQPILDSLLLRLAQDNPKFSYGTLRIAGAPGWAFTGIITDQLIDAIAVAGFRDLSSCACKQPIFFPDVLTPGQRSRDLYKIAVPGVQPGVYRSSNC
jgi:MFS family permease